ncbi:protein of unknown function [Candidatus Nitrospira inopinata]|uniref:Uncharacterized protein n=1 Tax=Candidatus Nitrospira inopinata TaxID=1715989 RepID=A0A0S4KPT0_9BACT|nr:protein of unknown function [Candidatus Nitrospira inopinata]
MCHDYRWDSDLKKKGLRQQISLIC